MVGAGEVVLGAGAVATPQVLMRSGIGPADELRAPGSRCAPTCRWAAAGPTTRRCSCRSADADPPGAPARPGQPGRAGPGLRRRPGRRRRGAAVRPAVLPGGAAAPHVRAAGPGQPRHDRARPRPTPRSARSRYDYLRTEHDRRRLRHAIRTAAELLRAGLGTRIAPGGDVLGNDRVLDGWIAANLTTSVHLSGSAAIGPGGGRRAARARRRGAAGRRHVGAAGGPAPRHRRHGRRDRGEARRAAHVGGRAMRFPQTVGRRSARRSVSCEHRRSPGREDPRHRPAIGSGARRDEDAPRPRGARRGGEPGHGRWPCPAPGLRVPRRRHPRVQPRCSVT